MNSASLVTANGPLHAATVRCTSRASELPATAVALLDTAKTTSLQLGNDWLALLAETVFPQDDVRWYCLHAGAAPDSACLAVLPVRVRPAALGHDAEALANYYTAVYSPVWAADLGTDGAAQALALMLRQLIRDTRGLARMTFAPMDPTAPAYVALQMALTRAGLRTFTYFCFGNWVLKGVADYAAFLASRDGRGRNQIVRVQKRFAEAGGTTQIFKLADEAEPALAAYEAVYARSWKQAEPYPGFIAALVRSSAARGELRLGVAWLEGQPIAAQIWLVGAGRADIYKVAYDEAFKKHSPGTVLTAVLMRHVLDVDLVREVDFLVGDDGYKKEWMSERRERWGLVAYRPATPRGLWLWLVEALGRRVKPWVLRWRARRAAQQPKSA
ncbi:MAG: GNAT family N-acetyltransferase [Rubrivivax sp.]|nr:GNAT family N-acetyltransferase [Rubrivivax sp.]